MSSSRDSPFSFSPDLRACLGSPDPLNASVIRAFPSLMGDPYTRPTVLHYAEDGRAHVSVRPGASVPAGTLLGLFSGHIFFDDGPRGALLLPLPAALIAGVEHHLSVDGGPRAARLPSSANAALFTHSCGPCHARASASVVGSWWTDGLLPCLLAHAARPLSENEPLYWNFDDPLPARAFTMSWPEARAWRRSGQLFRRCPCNAPRDCPRDRYLRTAAVADG